MHVGETKFVSQACKNVSQEIRQPPQEGRAWERGWKFGNIFCFPRVSFVVETMFPNLRTFRKRG